MNETVSRLIHRVFQLPAYVFYAAWGFGFLIILGLLYRSHLPEAPESFGPDNSELRYDSQPEMLFAHDDWFERLKDQSRPTIRLKLDANEKLTELSRWLNRSVVGEIQPAPSWISADFECSGIDRDKFQRRFNSAPVFVQRWQKSVTSPAFSGSDALLKLTQSSFSSWSKSSDFRIEFHPFQTTNNSATQTTITVAFECFGQLAADNGRQGTGIWTTVWNQIAADQWQLISITAVAQEEVAMVVAGGRLFQDCTASILARCKSLDEQLLPSLDQWARRIPNLDIIGNQGIAVGDINHDGLDDLYICQPHGLPNLLLIQNPDGTVDDFSKSAGVDILDQSFAALMIDLDNDRDQDLAITTDEGLLLLANKGNEKFQLEAVLPIGRGAESLSAADFDQDGDLDLFLCKPFSPERIPDLMTFPKLLDGNTQGGRNVLLRNDEGWKFSDATEQSGLTINNDRHSRSAVWIDFDIDGDQDLYISNEYASDQLLRNDTGWFTDVTQAMELDQPGRHRTVSVGEFNQDGRLDLFIATDATLRVPVVEAGAANSGADEFWGSLSPILTSESQIWFSKGNQYQPFWLRAPIFRCGAATGSCAADLNNDGIDDLIVANGFLSRTSSEQVESLLFDGAIAAGNESQSDKLKNLAARSLRDVLELVRSGYSFNGQQRNRCFLSIGAPAFANLSAASGLDFPDDARAVATTDWDQDGDIDIVMTCRTSPQLRIFCNQLGLGNGFISFDLIGTTSNNDAIGARVEVFRDGDKVPLVKSVAAGSGYLSQSSKRLTFGLGGRNKIQRVVVTWPSGEHQEFSKVVPNSRFQIVEGIDELAEKTNDRFRLNIHSQAIRVPPTLPIKRRALFYPESALPRLMFQGATNKFYPLQAINNEPMLALFFGTDSASQEKLHQLSRSGGKLSEANLDCLGLFCDLSDSAAEQSWQRATSVIRGREFPFRWGVLTPASLEKLKHTAGQWFSDHQLPPLPFGLLIDSSQQVIGFYPADSLAAKTVINDLPLIQATTDQYQNAAATRDGFWAARYRYPTLSRLGVRLAEVGYVDDADQMLRLELPNQANLLVQRAIEQIARGNNEAAEAMLDKAIELNPTCVPAFITSGDLQTKLAREVVGNDSDHDAEWVLEQRARLKVRALEDYEYAAKLDPLNTDALLGQANVALEQNQIEKALKRLQEFIEMEPERYEVKAMIGRLLFHQGKYRESLNYFIEAVNHRPTLPYLAGDIGMLYLKMGEFKTAQKFLQLAFRLQPSDRNIMRLLAEAEFLTGSYDEASRLLKQVVIWEPTRDRPKMMLSWIYATSPYDPDRNGELAIATIQGLVDLKGEQSPAILEVLAAGLAESGKFDDALATQQRALELMEAGSLDAYTTEQKQGLHSRRELYRRQRPYRTDIPTENPFHAPGT